jgi:ATP phosphoribosyltransferase regulatory subunit
MTDPINRALLPAGLHDVLPREAAFEATIVERLMAEFALNGFDRVKPPLIEFEASLLSGPGAAMATQTFRLMDPVSQRMLALRPDMTLQVARIATTRLVNEPRPLRLSYGGQVLRVKGSQLRPQRQFGQVGVELIGTLLPTADAEVVLLAYRALDAVGVNNISVDLNVPTLVPAVCRALDLPEEETARLRQALDRKDAAEVAAVGGKAAELLASLMRASGPADRAVDLLAALDLPSAADGDRQRLTEVVRLIRAGAPRLMLTVDAVEHRGFEYQTGISFTLFSRGVSGELGRGGRYRAGAQRTGNQGEPATGFTLYLDTILRAVPDPAPCPRVFLPVETDDADGARLRSEGWVTVRALESFDNPAAEARRLHCTHIFVGGQTLPAA